MPDGKSEKSPSKVLALLKALYSSAAIFFIPGIILTFFSPAFTIDLLRVSSDRVDAAVRKNILFAVPVATETIRGVTGVSSDIKMGGAIREGRRPTGRDTGSRAEDEGTIYIFGARGAMVAASVSPRDIDTVLEEIEFFLDESNSASRRLWVVSNWKFGLLPGAILLFSVCAFFVSFWMILRGKHS